MKAISYSLFGYGKKYANCFEFDSYLRALMVNCRINRVLYPQWINVINIDSSTYNSPYKPIFDWLQNKVFIVLNLCESSPLCMNMLWRLKPIFHVNHDQSWTYSHVICRDLDSVTTFREVQAVHKWIEEDKTIHCITDSISHNIPMMGGMIGFNVEYFTMRSGIKSWNDLIAKSQGINYDRKGADQDFLCKYIYPFHHDSATEHFILGMKQTIKEGNGRHYMIEDIDIGIDPVYKNTNDMAGHIGASGAYEPVLVRWLNVSDPYENEYAEIEKQFPKLFFWR